MLTFESLRGAGAAEKPPSPAAQGRMRLRWSGVGGRARLRPGDAAGYPGGRAPLRGQNGGEGKR